MRARHHGRAPFECDSAETADLRRMVRNDMGGAIDGRRKADGSGAVSAAANRRAFRMRRTARLFREYFAMYAREQAYCHFSPALIENLESHWNAKTADWIEPEKTCA